MAKIFESIQGTTLDKPVVLTIGNFDGVHKGHQALIQHVVSLAHSLGESTAAITFRQHPSDVLRADQSLPRICTLEHKLSLLECYGIDNIFSLEFTKAFSEQAPKDFLTELRRHILFNSLVLGYDARFGKDRKGDETTIKDLAKELNFNVEYLAPYQEENQIVSSSVVRQAILKGDFKLAERYLGRPYSIYNKVESGAGRGQHIGFPTANLKVNQLSLPPLGVYVVKVRIDEKYFWGVANLGYAPTVRQEKEPLLEVHLLDHSHDLYGQFMEVIFTHYLRPEQTFQSLEDLKAQIGRDVTQARQISELSTK